MDPSREAIGRFHWFLEPLAGMNSRRSIRAVTSRGWVVSAPTKSALSTVIERSGGGVPHDD
jgi:hypothetical protein